jgi:hypothetical protein
MGMTSLPPSEFSLISPGTKNPGQVTLPSVQRNRQKQFLVRHESFLLYFYLIRELSCQARNQNGVQIHDEVQVHPILFLDHSGRS